MPCYNMRGFPFVLSGAQVCIDYLGRRAETAEVRHPVTAEVRHPVMVEHPVPCRTEAKIISCPCLHEGRSHTVVHAQSILGYGMQGNFQRLSGLSMRSERSSFVRLRKSKTWGMCRALRGSSNGVAPRHRVFDSPPVNGSKGQ